jgi:hypothetical protein
MIARDYRIPRLAGGAGCSSWVLESHLETVG